MDLFRLSDEARKKVSQNEASAEDVIERILKNLFGADPSGYLRYSDAFVETVCTAFSEIGEESAALLINGDGYEERVSETTLSRLVDRTVEQYPALDRSRLARGLERFFAETDPDFQQMQWIMAQNFFAMHVLGMGSTDAQLSWNVFRNALLLLDTNVVIMALEPSASGHDWFSSLVHCLKILEVQLVVATPTLKELDHFIEGQRADIRLLASHLPGAILSQVRSFL